MPLLFVEHSDVLGRTPRPEYEYLYDKYGPALYGFMSRTANLDKEMAGNMLIEVFCIWCRQEDIAAGPFIRLMQIMITVMNKEGYSPCLPLLRCAGPETEQLG
jgi:hypothetical protein